MSDDLRRAVDSEGMYDDFGTLPDPQVFGSSTPRSRAAHGPNETSQPLEPTG